MLAEGARTAEKRDNAHHDGKEEARTRLPFPQPETMCLLQAKLL